MRLQNGAGILYDRRLLVAYIAEATEKAKAGSRVTLLPQGKAFAGLADELASSLAGKLALPPAVLDRSVDSLKLVDQSIRHGDPRRFMAPDVFAPLVAYIGEVIRLETQGRWEMSPGADGASWEPWVVGSSGRRYAPARFYKELLEFGRLASAVAFVSGTIPITRAPETE